MKEQIQAKFDEDGVSPVIGVILMVAVTVALVALVTVIVFDIGGDVSESPDATVDFAQDGTNVTATVLRNENVDKFLVRGAYDEGSVTESDTGLVYSSGGGTTWGDYTAALNMSNVGDTVNVPNEIYDGTTKKGELTDGEQVQVIAVMGDGSEQVLTTTTYDA